tara:strand:- start:18247 stop:18804 length:558 start_codon:yes stop_codon:yes gene_type:complete
MIEIENTPNPNAIKFLTKSKISSVGVKEFQKSDIEKVKNNHVKNLLSIEGVELILFSENFLSVKKNENAKWEIIKPTVISSLNDFFYKNKGPILSDKESMNDNLKTTKDKTVSQIIEVLDSKIRPAVARDGGDIKFVSFKDGVVTVELRGSCSGCPSSLMTLKKGVQNLLCHYVKEVKSVEATQR